MAILIKFLYGIYEIVMAMRRKNEQFSKINCERYNMEENKNSVKSILTNAFVYQHIIHTFIFFLHMTYLKKKKNSVEKDE
ncbi:hypothetical protein PFAG_02810 [Plasmodium falciparum Santa Lucia]|uniref:Uncharacterized protein n=9 Tax=Plasmodium falciparum TaxID=5833 RepID=W4J2W2_PLAFP|nr:hypothetical protein PFFVO_02823 [Plasmodium falciparum Vietnam Oak-Knoll (FVO)]ETW36480.1 hypothetical protein PFTANZ_02880 [Plasmodium falciparum Tanzania (2000708)]ETW42708.1 hypothetical protein PFNF135_02980 [Plasmodium falciparum NF135/5.C10]ETW49123.1 hypothetical protein PFMALIP_02825 [Plasmodium falciparum MaliPS096_E11]ETW56555.1 hypothetical protein PFUGPA_01345 [Plasmodium falciparum Palo Alto/Uganda]ETW61385.1 hypothetical protein PFMC_02805 [Plasmodium falciparum CAMP/Malaysia